MSREGEEKGNEEGNYGGRGGGLEWLSDGGGEKGGRM